MASQNSINNTVTDNDFTVPSGNITASGTISSSAADVTAATTMTAGTGLTVTTGNADVLAGNLNVGSAAPGNPYDISVEKTVAGLIGSSMQNLSANIAAGVNMQLIVEPATADPFVLFNVNGAATFSSGIDNSDSDSWKLTTGASPSVGTEVFVVSTAGAVTMNGGSVNIGTSNAADAINIAQGTTARAIGIGNSAAPHILTLGSVDTTAQTTLQSGTGNLLLSSQDELTLDAVGVLELNSSASTISVGNDAVDGAVFIGTGANLGRAVNLGSLVGTSSTTVNCGTGGASFAGSANAHSTYLGGTFGASDTTLQSGSGALNVTSTNGALTINSGTGALGISTDAAATTVSFATGGGVKSVTLGSTNTTSATTVQSGTGALNVTSTNGAMTINSGTGAMSLSNDASATTVTIATGGAAKAVTVGSTNTTSSLALQYGTNDFTLASATGTVISALDTGEITKPLQPAFMARKNTLQSNVTGNGTAVTVVYGVELFDQNSDYDTATSIFTAPVTGRYFFTAAIRYTELTGGTSGSISIVTTARTFIPVSANLSGMAVGAASLYFNANCFANMTAGDTCYISTAVSGIGADTADLAAASEITFGGFLVC